MTTTDNLGLSLPEGSDYADIETLNENFRTLDAQALKAQTAKDTPADADQVPIIDSADDSSKTKLVLWSAIKALFAAATHSHAWSAITDKPSSFTPSAHADTHKTGGTDALTAEDIGAAQVTVLTYEGTGANGSSDQNTLPVTSSVKLIIIRKVSNISDAIASADATPLLLSRGHNGVTVSTSNAINWGYNTTTWTDDTVSWYAGSASLQKNISGQTYEAILIG